MRRLLTTLCVLLLICLVGCVDTEKPSIDNSPSAILERAENNGASAADLIGIALKLGDDDCPNKADRSPTIQVRCTLEGPPQYWTLGCDSYGHCVTKYRTVCGSTYYVVESDHGDHICFGPQGDPYGCPI